MLTKEEESLLVDYIEQMSGIGYPLTRIDVREEVGRIINSEGRITPFKDGVPGILRQCYHLI